VGRSRIGVCVGVLAALLFALTGCGDGGGGGEGGGGGGGGGGGQGGDVRLSVVSHGQASDPFWSVVQNGVNAAAEDMGVEVEYTAPDTFDMVEMSQLIDAAVATEPDGLVVSIPDPDALQEAIQGAVDAGIPVVSMNSGVDVYEDLEVLTHVGQTELIAGEEAGARMADEGITNALCINQEVGNIALDQRCEGFEQGLGGTVEVVSVDLTDPTGAQSAIETALGQNPDVNGMLTLGPTGADPAIGALDASGRAEDVTLATFDLSPQVLEQVRDGNVLFAIDQQQYLQGYLPVVFLANFVRNGTIPAGEVLTGPAFVTQENAERVIQLSEEGIR
jgi:simple sugar transport system substrate-binding protein